MLPSWVPGLAAAVVFLHVLQKLAFPYFWADLWYLLKVVRYGIRLKMYEQRGELFTVLDRFLSLANKQPQKPFIIYEGDVHTYQDVDKRSNRVARVFLNHSALKRGDTVALLMSNEPDFVHVWFGLAKLGCVVAFLNSNIRSTSLLHCIRSCEPKAVVVGADLLGTVEEILPSLPEGITVWGMNDSVPQGVTSLKEKLSMASDKPVPRSHHVASSLKSPHLYIFTSGTTGLPKAAVISQLQALKGSAGLWAFGCTANDIIYITLPLYHSSGALLGIGGCVELGATCVLKKKFSASQFWNDCRKYNVTVFQYIGELCRYLCKQPKLLFTFDLIKYDFQKDEPIRNEQGWCIHVRKGEPGLLISRVNEKNPFFGYAGSKKHTEKKLLCDVFKKGDVYFNTGDLMVQDEENFLYFWDRIGDTFRWKGENVATTEVADVIGMLDFIQETNVYGVAVSDYEGKAGMASIILKQNKSLDLEKVYEQVVTFLPAYACPRFLRIQEKMETTGTFKLQKFQLVEEGFSPLKISDPLYFMDNLKKSYVPLTKELYNQIMLGEIKL
ncbi:long-chain fatty acid transport protein 6 isoform X2 [Canis lupus baileyi]|uniref:long-chain fatty acid transport protein 6 isoform X2 n=1 Tax=Canis lupus familiaris TaxID=9615 RepID=UPI0003AE08AA|nr:long-chain fatty acid transport protein 6 isoform X2 [Canis lupus familiaris]XP_038537346.1 long-chain fatty acid transport protein 6 isoform X2 [Canis lupus familiaris]|eukprot:XP_005626548.1 long-chain fatty acid transport protein 6 isoform X2 [Canis lupus familiaris]